MSTKDFGPGFLVSAEFLGGVLATMELIDSGVSIESLREINKRVRQRHDEFKPRAVHSAFGIVLDSEAA
jgi:hypothetical protein